MTTAFTELRTAGASVQKSCALTGISRATHYRHIHPKGPLHGPWLPRRPPPSALSAIERAAVLDLLASPAYADLAIPQVWARELDEGRYWCSMSTMYRIARAAGQVSERRRQATHPDCTLASGDRGPAAPAWLPKSARAELGRCGHRHRFVALARSGRMAADRSRRYNRNWASSLADHWPERQPTSSTGRGPRADLPTTSS